MTKRPLTNPSILCLAVIGVLALLLHPETTRNTRLLQGVVNRTLLFSGAFTVLFMAIACLRGWQNRTVDFAGSALAGSAAGAAAQLLLFLTAAAEFDQLLASRIRDLESQAGTFTVYLPGRAPLTVHPSGGSSTQTSPPSPVPPLFTGLLCAAQPEHCSRRAVNLHVEVETRGGPRSLRVVRSGCLETRPLGPNLRAETASLRLCRKPGLGPAFETLAGSQDDLASPEEHIRFYLALALFGIVRDHPLNGLFARLAAPYSYEPYSLPGETAGHLKGRLALHRHRTLALLDSAARLSPLSPEERDRARSVFIEGFLPASSLEKCAMLPALLRLVRGRVQSAFHRHVEIWGGVAPEKSEELDLELSDTSGKPKPLQVYALGRSHR